MNEEIHFGFEVIAPDPRYPDYNAYNQYVVQLPHSCDEWVIAENPNKEDSIRDLESFIEQAKAALVELRRMK